MNFLEADTGGVSWKKLFLKISKNSQESCRPVALLKTDSNTVTFLWILGNFWEHLFWRMSARWAAAAVLSFLLSLDNLLRG